MFRRGRTARGYERMNSQTPTGAERTLADVYDADVHLQRLIYLDVDRAWYSGFLQNVKEFISPPKLPPLQVTSKPVAVKNIWGLYGDRRKQSASMSLLLHLLVVLFAIWLGSLPSVRRAVRQTVGLVAPIDLAPWVPDVAPQKQKMGGGGGGGDNSPVPASKGKLPRVAPRQFVPPMAVVNNPNPKLLMEPTIIAQPNANLPQLNMAVWGDPFGRLGPLSNGPGSGGGIGSGSGGGVGSGDGPGFGPGRGGGVGGGAYRIGGGVSAPQLLFKVEPEYSEEARKAKFQGTVVLYIVVDEKGLPRDLKVVRPLGLGLDEKALEAVTKWRFKPGYKDGRPVAVVATIEVNFRLL